MDRILNGFIKKVAVVSALIVGGAVAPAQAQESQTSWDFDLDSEEYNALSGCEKQDFLWDTRIVPSAYGEGGPRRPSFDVGGGWQALLSAPGALLSLGRSFDHVSDEMPRGRSKFIHTFGSVAMIEFRAEPDSPYTGLLAADAVCGLARLSLAGPPAALGYTPGMALKFFVDGQPSMNLHVMNSLNGQGDNYNFFERPFSNVLEKPGGWLLRTLAWWFGLFVENPFYLGLDHVTSVNPDGTPVDSPETPFELVFVAGEGVSIPSDTDRDLRDELGDIEPGTVLYQVFARQEEGGDLVPLGQIITLSTFVASEWGDQQLFFQHN